MAPPYGPHFVTDSSPAHLATNSLRYLPGFQKRPVHWTPIKFHFAHTMHKGLLLNTWMWAMMWCTWVHIFIQSNRFVFWGYLFICSVSTGFKILLDVLYWQWICISYCWTKTVYLHALNCTMLFNEMHTGVMTVLLPHYQSISFFKSASNVNMRTLTRKSLTWNLLTSLMHTHNISSNDKDDSYTSVSFTAGVSTQDI